MFTTSSSHRCSYCEQENPYGWCRCNSRSAQPCQSCDWADFHECIVDDENEEEEDE